MRRILFPRLDGGPGGGEIKFRDYFDHCLAYPAVDPYVYLHAPSGPSPAWREIWAGVAPDRIVPVIDLSRFEMLFLGGINWELVPDTSGKTVVNLIQGLNHADSRYPKLLRFLRNFAHRICVSPQVLDAIRPYAAGPLVLIRNGIPLERCRRRCTDAGSVVIVARKRAEFGEALRERMVRTGNRVEVLITWTPRETFLARLGTADIFVGLPYQAEGFYLPALEAMASGCAVVCADAGGNREFCVPGVTCLMPEYDDLEGHAAAVEALVRDAALRERIRAEGFAASRAYSLDRERLEFHQFLDGLLRSPVEGIGIDAR